MTTTTSNTYTLPEVVDEVAELCRARGLSLLAGRAEELLSRERPRWMLVAGAEDLLDTWAAERIREIAAGSVREIGLDELARDPDRSLDAERLVVLLECGRLLSAEGMEVLASAVEGRPEGTFAIVFRERGELGDPEDLELFERGVRRWALDAEQTGDLSAHGVYLAGGRGGPDFLRDRLAEDRRAFERWVEAPPAPGESLERWRALRLLESTEAALRNRPRTETETPEVDTKTGAQEARAARELARSRKLLPSRIDADLDVLERGLVNRLDQAVERTTAELRSMLAREMPALPSSAGLERLRRLVEETLHASEEAWRREATRRIETAEERMLQDLRSLLSVVDWTLVDRIAPAPAGDSPARLLDRVDGRIVAELTPALTGEAFQGPSGGFEGPGGSRTFLGFSAVAAAVFASILLAMNIPFLWTSLVSGSAAAGTGWLGMAKARTRRARTTTAAMERTLERHLESAEREIRDAVRRLRPLLVEPLEEEIEALEAALLGPEPERGGTEGTCTTPIERDLETLRELRRRAATVEGT